MKLQDVKEQCQIGDFIMTKKGHVSDNNYLPRAYKIEIVRIEVAGNSIKLFFDKNKVENLVSDKSQSNRGYHNKVRGTILNNYVTASMIEKVIKNPTNAKSTLELFDAQILKRQVNIKNLLGSIEKEKESILEIEDRKNFIKLFKLDRFDAKKYKAYRLIEEVRKITDGTSSVDVIDEVAKLI